MADDEHQQESEAVQLSDDTPGLCRICHHSSPIDSLLVPCECTGDQRYVHPRCLDDWRALNLDGQSFLHCTVCHTEYDIVYTLEEEETTKKATQLDPYIHSSVFVSTVGVVFLSALLFLCVFINACDLQNNIPSAFPSLSPLLAYLVIALLCLLFLLTVAGIVGYMYGLHLPMVARANWYSDVYEYAETRENRADHCFCFHPDFYCYNCYGLQYEYALMHDHQPYYVEYMVVVAMVSATLLAGLVVGAPFAVYLLYRTGGRFVDKHRLYRLTHKYRVRDRRHTELHAVDYTEKQQEQGAGLAAAESDENIHQHIEQESFEQDSQNEEIKEKEAAETVSQWTEQHTDQHPSTSNTALPNPASVDQLDASEDSSTDVGSWVWSDALSDSDEVESADLKAFIGVSTDKDKGEQDLDDEEKSEYADNEEESESLQSFLSSTDTAASISNNRPQLFV